MGAGVLKWEIEKLALALREKGIEKLALGSLGGTCMAFLAEQLRLIRHFFRLF